MTKFSKLLVPTLILISCMVSAQTPKRTLNVGIVLYPGVEVLDFSGPSEVFGATEGFRAFTVAYKKDPIISQGFVQVTPQYSIEDCPPTDILVFPGGGTGNVINEQPFIDWVMARSETTQIIMSVCTGAGILSKAKLLDGLTVTTFHGYIDGLQKMTPTATVLSDTRFVDNGHIVTTAGVSAGIDGALHVVARLKGDETAKATAYYMEYDKWQPKMGLINDTEFISRIKKDGFRSAASFYETAETNGLQPLYYDGELLNLSRELLTANPEESLLLLQWMSQRNPTLEVFDVMALALKALGKPGPDADRQTFLRKIENGEIDWAKAYDARLQKSFPGWKLYDESSLNQAAYQALNSNKKTEAVETFEWITELYPGSPNAWDSLAEGYELTGDVKGSVSASKKCLEVLKTSDYQENRRAMYEKIENERIARLSNVSKAK